MTNDKLLGKPVDGLPLAVRRKLTGKWIAMELYSPQRLPMRIIHAIGEDARDCVRQLQSRGLDPADYHYEALGDPLRE